jgi:hypothetical protein
MSDWPINISQCGLILDAVGATLIFVFIIPTKNVGRVPEDFDPEAESRKISKNKTIAWIGYTLIMIGFALQFIGSGTIK